ncbi:MAG: MarR family EPS-associated transcriptional regulator [Candidatus Tantalella remota]|nr:MarR family EPS-associated transcriptional regulator [Candidatus Tantalella remota]
MKNLEETLKILNHINGNPEATQRELVERLDVSLGKVNFLVKSLVETGLVKLERFKRSNNKKGYLYILTPKGVTEKADITRQFLQRKIEEHNKIKYEIETLKEQLNILGEEK